MSEQQQGDPADDAILATAADASLGAAEWPAGEADEPHGQSEVAASMEGSDATQAAGAPSAQPPRSPAERESDAERIQAERESDDGELTPSDPSQPIEEQAARPDGRTLG